MGCCVSKAEGTSETHVPQKCQKILQRGQYEAAGTQIGVSVAGDPSSQHLEELSVFCSEPGYILAALVSPHNRRDAAEYCSSRLKEVFAGQLVKAQGDVAHALAQSLHQLDRDFLECKAYTEIVRAGSGADVSIAVLDAQTLVIHLASVGRGNAVLGELQHGLAQQVSEAAFLFPYAGNGPAPIGMGMQRDQRLADLCGLQPCPLQPELAVQIAAKQLLPVHESIIIGSPGFWDLASPAACALRAHFYLKATAGSLHPPAGMEATVQQTADHLVTFAVQQETLRHPGWNNNSNIAALVLTLKWPANSMNQAFASGGKLLEGLQRSAAQQTLVSGRAQRRWRLIRMLCVEYPRAHRRMVLQKWRRTVQQAVDMGQKQARKLEEELWKSERLVVHVSPSLAVRNQRGHEIKLRPRKLDCTAFA